MGTDAQVCIKTEDGPLYFYRHYDGPNVVWSVQKALAMQKRWDDPHYLSRIIFEEMISGHADKECGFGIGLKQFSGISLLVTVDCEKQQVELRRDPLNVRIAFSEFIKADLKGIISS